MFTEGCNFRYRSYSRELIVLLVYASLTFIFKIKAASPSRFSGFKPKPRWVINPPFLSQLKADLLSLAKPNLMGCL